MRILLDILPQLFLPLQCFHLRHHTPHNRDASLPVLLLERLGCIANVFEIDLRYYF